MSTWDGGTRCKYECAISELEPDEYSVRSTAAQPFDTLPYLPSSTPSKPMSLPRTDGLVCLVKPGCWIRVRSRMGRLRWKAMAMAMARRGTKVVNGVANLIDRQLTRTGKADGRCKGRLG